MLRKLTLLFVTALWLSGLASVTQAQNNLLVDPSFEVEGDYKRVAEGDGAIFDVPQAWNGWVTTAPRTEPWMNLIPTGFPHFGLFKRDQNRSLHIARGSATFTTAVYQTVTVPENANVTGSAWGFMERKAGNAPVTPGGQFRVGIDPNGGANPLSPSIVWSPWVTTADGWYQATTNATAQGTRVTLFLYATQTQPSDPNGIYWDEASLTVGGPGGSAPPGSDATAQPGGPTNTPVIPTPAFASFVAPQPPQPDGSIIHTVQSGDTLDAIAVAYGKTRQQVLDLNPGMGTGRFIQIGQRILIQRAPASAEATGTPATSTTAQATAADAATSEATAAQTTTPEAAPTDEPDALDAGQAATDQPPTATPTDPPPTPTEAPPAPVTQVAQAGNPPAVSNVTALCIWMYEDANQNRIQEADEALLAGATITLRSGGDTVETYTTDGVNEPFCFEALPVGDYIAAAQPPAGYGLTTAASLSLRVVTGTTTNARFGAAQGVQVAVAPPDLDQEPPAPIIDAGAPDDGGLSLLQISGLIVFALAGLVMLGGIGVALILRSR